MISGAVTAPSCLVLVPSLSNIVDIVLTIVGSVVFQGDQHSFVLSSDSLLVCEYLRHWFHKKHLPKLFGRIPHFVSTRAEKIMSTLVLVLAHNCTLMTAINESHGEVPFTLTRGLLLAPFSTTSEQTGRRTASASRPQKKGMRSAKFLVRTC